MMLEVNGEGMASRRRRGKKDVISVEERRG